MLTLVSTLSRGKKQADFARFFFFFFSFVSGAKIDWRDVRGMVEGSVDEFIAKDYFSFSVEQFRIHDSSATL